jgi:tetratricopeptide (TPR) repeat protein
MHDVNDAPDADWRSRPNWFEYLAGMVGAALVAEEDDPFLELLAEVGALLASGHEEVAALVAQAALHRSLHGRVITRNFDAKQVTDSERLDDDIAAVVRAEPSSRLRAAALDAVGRLMVEQRRYEKARDAYLAAAEGWNALSEESLRALSLLRAGASAKHLEDIGDSVLLSRRAFDVFEGLGDVPGMLWAVLNLVQAESLRGDIDASRELLREARELKSGLRDGHASASIALEEAILAVEDGDVAAARDGFRKAYRSGRRRQDLNQALVAAKNLAFIAAEEQQQARSTKWWGVAADLASKLHDWREEQDVQRVRGVVLAQGGHFDEAIAAFDRALEINIEHESMLDLARTRADEGAVVLEYAIKGGISDARFEELTARGVALLNHARTELEQLADFEWAAIAVRNLRTAWVLRNAEADGATILIDAAERLDEVDVAYCVELRRNAAWLLLASGTMAADDPRPAAWLIESATAFSGDGVERAWSLAQQAGAAADRGFEQTALRLFDTAIEGLDVEENSSAFGNILNDSSLVVERQGDLDEAHRRLLRVEEIALRAQDRVLLNLAWSNLGETAVRQGDDEAAREYFSRSIGLAEELGDAERVAIGLASLANTYVNDEDQVSEAARLGERALSVADVSGSEEARLRAASTTASVAFAQGDFETAFRIWSECADSESAADGAEHQAYALDSLAQLGNWPRFKRELDKYARRAQKAGSQFAFVEKLHLSALTWLRHGRAAAAGTVLAYGVLLAFEAASKGYGETGRLLSTSDREQAMVRTGVAMGPARAVLVLLDIPARMRATARRAYERTLRKAVGEDADQLIETIDRLMLGADEDDADSRV